MEISLNELDDKQLLRLIITKLWRILDAGGISYGRSRRAICVECIQELMPFSLYLDGSWNLSDYCLEQIEIQVYGRKKKNASQLILFKARDLPAEAFPADLLIRLLLKHLMNMYKADKRKGQLSSYIEYALAKAAFELFPLPKRCPKISLEKIYYTIAEKNYEEQKRELSLV